MYTVLSGRVGVICYSTHRKLKLIYPLMQLLLFLLLLVQSFKIFTDTALSTGMPQETN